MAATKLGLYCDALDIIGERRLVSLADDEKSRYDLDAAWDKGGTSNGGPIYCLELGLWGHATRSSAFTYSPSIQPPFGFQYAFDKPNDWLRTAAVCSDERFKVPLDDTGYADEQKFWFADLQTIFVKYISQDIAYGLDMSLWQQSFNDFVALYLADSVCLSITQNLNKSDAVHKAWEVALKKAAGIDGTNKPTVTRSIGNWAGARFGSRGRCGHWG